MRNVKKSAGKNSSKRIPPAKTPEAREQQLISLAVDRAEQQLLEGTASAQVIVHYLKLGTTRERLEQKKIEQEIALSKAKAEMLESTKHIEELYANALNAMRIYGGKDNDDEE